MAVDAKSLLIVVMLFVMICALASAVDVSAFITKLKKPKGILIGLICQYGFLPLMGYLLCLTFDFDYETSIALILTSTCPGGVLSNFFAFTIGADLPLSIAMTTTSSILAFAFIPLNSFLYIKLGLEQAENVAVDWFGLFISTIVLICGIVIGLYIAYKKIVLAQKILAPLASLFILIVIIASFYDNLTSEYPFYAISWKYHVAPLVLTTCGWVFGLFFALLTRLRKVSAVSVGIETSNQNGALAMTILALSIPSDDIYNRVVVIPAEYMILSWIVNLVFVLVFLKLGWVDVESEDENDQSVNLCILIRRYKNRKTTNETEQDNDGNGKTSQNDIDDTELVERTDVVD
eukprot:145150_1